MQVQAKSSNVAAEFDEATAIAVGIEYRFWPGDGVSHFYVDSLFAAAAG